MIGTRLWREVPVNVLIDTDILIDLALGGNRDEPAAHLVTAARTPTRVRIPGLAQRSPLRWPRARERCRQNLLLDLAQFVEVAPTYRVFARRVA
jgi:hypothetical protein